MRRLCKPQAISITRSEMPSVVRRKTSLTIRQRLTPAMACSTTIRTEEMIRFRKRSSMLSACPLGFFGLGGQHTLWLIALKAGVFIKGGIDRIGHFGLVCRFLVMGGAHNSWSHIAHFS